MKKKSDRFPGNAFLRELLIEKINSVLPGGKLPGLRSLMLESGCGRLRIEHLLQEFANDGIIEIRPRSGCYRMAVEESPAIAFIYFGILPLSTLETDFYGGIWHPCPVPVCGGGRLIALYCPGLCDAGADDPCIAR